MSLPAAKRTSPAFLGLEVTKTTRANKVSLNISGTECYDVSSMGAMQGLLGRTARTLAIWMEQRRRTAEELGLRGVCVC